MGYYFSPKRIKNIILLCASLFFYAWGEQLYLLILLFSILLNYGIGLLIDLSKGKRAKIVVFIGVIANLFILGYYKYYNFLVDSINQIFSLEIKIDDISLPIGISFFTFQAISYLIDVYRKKVLVQKNIFNLALYISFFPQLIAGPIVRYNDIEKQLNARKHTWEGFSSGVERFAIGLAKKVLIANSVGQLADSVFQTPSDQLTLVTAWLGIIAYTLQIYFDFSGYSDMAIGLGRMFGFKFLENFNYPYISKNISEFWNRWHISLSNWFRDYVYIPLGGNRKGELRSYINLLIVWTLTGFWHGASWTFMMWGLYYGILICIEKKWLLGWMRQRWQPFQHIYTLIFVMIGWVFFRADNFSYSIQYVKSLFGIQTDIWDNMSIYLIHDYAIILLIGILFSLPIYNLVIDKLNGIKESGWIVILINFMKLGFYGALVLVSTIYLVNSTYNPFIYFRF